ncbi:DUF1824 family protein [Altericista sp. CCNU0014]|uniref:DUF1824 family protein n=1 Tax=Altericista sp. CCNU0014 TaxID=3082949 RepID=UPI00385068FE
MQSTSPMTTARARSILAPFNCLEVKTIADLEEKIAVRQAVLHLASIADTHMFGILAADWDEAIAALYSYAKAFGETPPAVAKPCDGAVYIKFNPRSGSCYASPYLDDRRGILIAFQSDFADGINEMCGHLPLDLFDARER